MPTAPWLDTLRHALAEGQPVSRVFGLDRGRAIDRHYIDGFLADHAAAIRGRVLEIGDATYTRRFGGAKVTRSDVLHAVAGNPQATIVGDLATGDGVPEAAFDCIILTQTLHCIHDFRGALATARRALAPGGVLLATLPGVSQVSRYDMERWGDFWRFSAASARREFIALFPGDAVAVEARGTLLAATAFVNGLAVEDLPAGAFDESGPTCELVILVRVDRAPTGSAPPPVIDDAALEALRAASGSATLGQAGTLRLGGWRLGFDDLRGLHQEVKAVFRDRVAHGELRRPAALVVDAGAGLGLAALYVRALRPDARLLCVEADPRRCSLLRGNLERNGLANATVVEARLGDPEGGPERGGAVRLSDHLTGPVDLLRLDIGAAALDVLRDLERAGQLTGVAEAAIIHRGLPDEPQWLGTLLDLLDRNGLRYRLHGLDDDPDSDQDAPWRGLVRARRRPPAGTGA